MLDGLEEDEDAGASDERGPSTLNMPGTMPNRLPPALITAAIVAARWRRRFSLPVVAIHMDTSDGEIEHRRQGQDQAAVAQKPEDRWQRVLAERRCGKLSELPGLAGEAPAGA